MSATAILESAYTGGLPGAEPRPSAVSMPTSFAEPLLMVDVERMQQMDVRSVESLFSMWSGTETVSWCNGY